VLVLHHPSHDNAGRPQGSREYKPAGDQGFMCANFNPKGLRLLHQIRLVVHTSKYGLSSPIVYNYSEGQMTKSGSDNSNAILTSVLAAHPADRAHRHRVEGLPPHPETVGLRPLCGTRV
jgi:hypothetical protein